MELFGRVLVRLDEEERHEKREDREEIDDVETALEELPLVRGGGEPEDVLHREPRNADFFDHRELRVVQALDVAEGAVTGSVHCSVHLQGRDCV